MKAEQRGLRGLTCYDPAKAYNGYTLFAPMWGKDVWLIDMCGRFVHRWQMPHTPGCYGRLLPNGNLLYQGKVLTGPLMDFGGSAGVLLEVDWNGNVVWSYEDPYLSHDFCRMENGNTLVIRFVPTPDDIARRVKGGVPGTERQGVMWSDALQEITPEGKVAWEWIGYEHLDPEIDVISPLLARSNWTQANSCFVMADGNILLSFAWTNTIAVINKATGDIKWRWGPGDLGFQHDATELDNGNILVFDNGRNRPLTRVYSRVIEINPTSGEIEWEYKADPPHSFYASFIGGCQRLPNRNTLICEGPLGRFFEVTPAGEIVWEYINPFYHEHPSFGRTNMTFRAYRYGPDYAGLKGTGLDDPNLLYGPEASRSITLETTCSTKALQSSITQKRQSMPGVREKGPSETIREEKLRSRLEHLGY